MPGLPRPCAPRRLLTRPARPSVRSAAEVRRRRWGGWEEVGGGAAAPAKGAAPAGQTSGWGRAWGGGWAKRGSGAAGQGAGSAVRSLALGGEPWPAGRPRASPGLLSSGLPVPRSALHRLSAPPRAARPRSVRGPAGPSLSRRICAHCSSEGAGPARPEASWSFSPSSLSPPL